MKALVWAADMGGLRWAVVQLGSTAIGGPAVIKVPAAATPNASAQHSGRQNIEAFLVELRRRQSRQLRCDQERAWHHINLPP
jgi:hypothetical protein